MHMIAKENLLGDDGKYTELSPNSLKKKKEKKKDFLAFPTCKWENETFS